MTRPELELEELLLYREDAIEALLENEQVITAQRLRIEELENMLKRTRAGLWEIYCYSVGVLNDEYAVTKDQLTSAVKAKRKRSAS